MGLGERRQVLGERSTAPQNDGRDGQRLSRKTLNQRQLSVALTVDYISGIAAHLIAIPSVELARRAFSESIGAGGSAKV